MTSETMQDAIEDAAAATLAAEQTALDGEGFEKPVKTRRELAEEFLEHFQADVESAEKSLVNARIKLRTAQEIRDDAEENLRSAIREDNGKAAVGEAVADMRKHAEESGTSVTISALGKSVTFGPAVDPITGEISLPPLERDELLTDAVRLVVNTGAASAALLQRRLTIGYGRAGEILDQLESLGVVDCPDPDPGAGSARSVLIDESGMDAVLAKLEPAA